jgi:tetratricopeptide (TPR) repeat protein
MKNHPRKPCFGAVFGNLQHMNIPMKWLPVIITLLFCAQLKAQTDSAAYFYAQGKQAREEKKYLLAERHFGQALKYDKDNEAIQLDQAAVLLEMKKYYPARGIFEQILQKTPNHKLALEQMALLSFNQKQWADAEKYGKQCLAAKIGSGMNYRVAKSLFQQESYPEASKYLEAANAEDPKNAEVPWLMANIWLEMNHVQKGIEMYEIALSLDSSNQAWHYDLAGIFNQTGNAKKALYHYERALALGLTTDLNTMAEIGNVYLANQQFDKGLELMKKVIAKKPLDKTLYNDVAYGYYNAKKYKDAIQWWDEILRIDKTDARALYMIGIAYQKDGNKEKGSRLCDAAIALDPSLQSLRKEQKMEGLGL